MEDELNSGIVPCVQVSGFIVYCRCQITSINSQITFKVSNIENTCKKSCTTIKEITHISDISDRTSYISEI